MIHIVVTGSECTGKTTLARALAGHYETSCVPEFVRRFVAEKGVTPDAEDVTAVARGQMALQDKHSAAAATLLVHDTDLLSTVVYSTHYYDGCPAWIEPELRARAADLYLLAGIDVPWVADGEQRDRGDRREEMQALFRDALSSRGFPFVELRGDRAERLTGAIRAVDRVLNA